MSMWQDLTGDNTKQIDEIIEKTFSNDQQHEVILVSKKNGLERNYKIFIIFDSIGTPISCNLLKKSDWILTLAGQVVCLPAYFLGLGISISYVGCGIARIIIFVNNMGSETLTSKLPKYTIQLLQLDTKKLSDILFQKW